MSHQIRHWIGAYFLQFNGLDALVFTAGIGENRAAPARRPFAANLDQLGIVLDPKLNGKPARGRPSSARPNRAVKVMVIPTNEELVVAREVRRFLQTH